MAGIGFLTMIGLFIYNRLVAKHFVIGGEDEG